METGGMQGAAAGLGAGLAAGATRAYESRNLHARDIENSAAYQARAIQQYVQMGTTYEAKKDWGNAEKAFRYVLTMVARMEGVGSAKSVPALQHLVKITAAQNNLGDAINFQKTVVMFKQKDVNVNPLPAVNAQLDLSKLYVLKEDYSQAERTANDSMSLANTSYGISAEKRLETHKNYAAILRKLNREADATALEAADKARIAGSSEAQASPAANATAVQIGDNNNNNNNNAPSSNQAKDGVGTNSEAIVHRTHANSAASSAYSGPAHPAKVSSPDTKQTSDSNAEAEQTTSTTITAPQAVSTMSQTPSLEKQASPPIEHSDLTAGSTVLATQSSMTDSAPNAASGTMPSGSAPNPAPTPAPASSTDAMPVSSDGSRASTPTASAPPSSGADVNPEPPATPANQASTAPASSEQGLSAAPQKDASSSPMNADQTSSESAATTSPLPAVPAAAGQQAQSQESNSNTVQDNSQ